MKKENINMKIEDGKTKKEEPTTEATLMFIRDRDDRNWISRLSPGKGDSAGKIVLLHRSDQTIPQPNIAYRCKIQEKQKETNGKILGYALAWIIGLAGYPRVVIKSDRTCVVIEDPSAGKKPKHYLDIYAALKDYSDLEYLFTVYRTENRREEIIDSSLLRDVNIEIKVKSEDSSIKANIKRKRLRKLDLKMIIDEIKKSIN